MAKLLNTSVEYLVTGTDRDGLNEEERKLVASYRQLSKVERDHILVIIEAWGRRFKNR